MKGKTLEERRQWVKGGCISEVLKIFFFFYNIIFSMPFTCCFFFYYKFIYFIFGCVGFLLLHEGFSLVAASGGYSLFWCTGFLFVMTALVAEHGF